jgi:5-methylcytosine-specific restriction endonuclease McrA
MPGNEGRAWRVVRSRVLRKQPVCGLCAQPINLALRWPHPQSGSVDHITPRSLGGARLDPANLRATLDVQRQARHRCIGDGAAHEP